MARQAINLGALPNGVGGDTPRSANVKINDMTQELYGRNAQLGTAANANIGVDPGNVMPVGAFGLGVRDNTAAASMNRWTTCFSIIADQTQYRPVGYGTLIDVGYPGGSLGSQLWMGVSPGGVIGFRSGDYATAAFNTIYHTGNTVRAQDGTLKGI